MSLVFEQDQAHSVLRSHWVPMSSQNMIAAFLLVAVQFDLNNIVFLFRSSNIRWLGGRVTMACSVLFFYQVS